MDDPELALLVERRLAALPPSLEESSVSIDLTTSSTWSAPEPPTEARVVHESEYGLVVYSDQADELWLRYGASGRGWCRPALGTASISVDRQDPSSAWTATRPLLTLALLELLKRHSLFAVHAGGAARDGAAIVAFGASGAGKSSTMLALAFAGWKLLGDDLVLFRAPDPAEVLAFPDEIDATKHTFTLFPQLGSAADWPMLPGYPKRQLSMNRLGLAPISSAKLRLLLALEIGSGRHHALEPLRSGDVLTELVPNIVPTEPAAAQMQLDLLGRLASDAPAYRLSLAPDIATLPATIERLLG